MSFKSAATALYLFLLLVSFPAHAGFNDIFTCWMPVVFGERTPPVISPINRNALESPLQRQARHFLSQQVVIADLARRHFSSHVKLRELLVLSRDVLKGILHEFPCGDETFRKNFGEARTLPQTISFFGSASLPRLATEQMEFQHQVARPALQRRLLKEMGAPPRSQSQQSFLDKLWAVRKSDYHRLDLSSVTAMFCFLGDDVDEGDDNYYLSFPEGEVIDTILKDAEARLEIARTSVSPRVAKEQFLIALYGYVVARPYRAGNQAIGWPIFAGIYQALTGDPLPGIYGRDDLSRMATLSQAWFVEKVGKDIEFLRRK